MEIRALKQRIKDKDDLIENMNSLARERRAQLDELHTEHGQLKQENRKLQRQIDDLTNQQGEEDA